MPSLSIIIPVYNVEKYLRQCLDSILVDNQFTGQVICVNDGSTDGSLAILEEYAEKYPNIEIYSQENLGQSVARNTGLDHAIGEYISFIDSDDWVFPNTINQVLCRIKNEDVIYFNAKKYFEETQTFDSINPIQEEICITGQKYFSIGMNRSTNLPFVCLVGGFYSRSFLIENHLYNEPGIYHEDSYFTPQVLLKAQKISTINIYLYAYRIRLWGSTSTSVEGKYIQDQFYVIRKLYSLYSQEPEVDRAFYNYLCVLYIEVIDLAFSNDIDIDKYWTGMDSIIFNKCAYSNRDKKIAKLSVLSRSLAYKYCQNSLPAILRKCINRFL